jgi:hypothetical protein
VWLSQCLRVLNRLPCRARCKQREGCPSAVCQAGLSECAADSPLLRLSLLVGADCRRACLQASTHKCVCLCICWPAPHTAASCGHQHTLLLLLLSLPAHLGSVPLCPTQTGSCRLHSSRPQPAGSSQRESACAGRDVLLLLLPDDAKHRCRAASDAAHALSCTFTGLCVVQQCWGDLPARCCCCCCVSCLGGYWVLAPPGMHWWLCPTVCF